MWFPPPKLVTCSRAKSPQTLQARRRKTSAAGAELEPIAAEVMEEPRESVSMTREPEEPAEPAEETPPPYSSRYSTREPEPRSPVSPVTCNGFAVDSERCTATLLKQEEGDAGEREEEEEEAEVKGQLSVEDVVLAKLDVVVAKLELVDRRLQAIEKKPVGCCSIL